MKKFTLFTRLLPVLLLACALLAAPKARTPSSNWRPAWATSSCVWMPARLP